MPSVSRLALDRSGSSAVEFAIIAPVFLMVLFSLIGYGIYLSAASAVQQIAANAARTAIAGLTATERQSLARDYISKSTTNFAFLNPSRFTVTVKDDAANPNQFTVNVEYDAKDLPIWNLYSYALPDTNIKRFSTIRIGGI